MNTLLAKGSWNIAKGKLKQKLARLAGDEIEFLQAKEEELLGRIQKRKGQELDGAILPMDECPACRHKAG